MNRKKIYIRRYLRNYLNSKFGNVVGDIIEWAPWVWRIKLNEEKFIAAKYQPLAIETRDVASDVLVVEREVLEFLFDRACFVPRWLGCDKKTGFAFYEWVGDDTLDDYAQTDLSKTINIIPSVIESFRSIDKNLNKAVGKFESRVITNGRKSDLLSGWKIVTERAKWGAKALCRHLGIINPANNILSGLDDVCTGLSQREPRIGSSDFNARNVIINRHRGPHFIEFAKLNWDWTERRLVQYTTSMGSREKKGSMKILLSKNNTDDISSVAALDAHQVVFLLNGAAALCSALDKDERSFVKYFQRTEFHSLQRRLIMFAKGLSAPISGDAKLCEIRSVFNIEKKEYIDE